MFKNISDTLGVWQAKLQTVSEKQLLRVCIHLPSYFYCEKKEHFRKLLIWKNQSDFLTVGELNQGASV